MIKNYQDGVLSITCGECRKDFDYEVPADFTPEFNEEFQEYENISATCPHCAETGLDSVVVININLPEGELDEEDAEYTMPFAEINARKYIRDLMWEVRPDLRERNREAFNQLRERVSLEKVLEARLAFGDFIKEGFK